MGEEKRESPAIQPLTRDNFVVDHLPTPGVIANAEKAGKIVVSVHYAHPDMTTTEHVHFWQLGFRAALGISLSHYHILHHVSAALQPHMDQDQCAEIIMNNIIENSKNTPQLLNKMITGFKSENEIKDFESESEG